MSAPFAKRRAPRKAELVDISLRQGLPVTHPTGEPLTIIELKADQAYDGRCEACGNGFRGVSVEYDHVIPNALQYEGDAVEWALLCGPCHADKTKRDVADIARAKRRSGATGQYARRKTRGRSLIQGRTEIQSRGFDKSLRRRMDGTVERRS